MPEPSCLGTWNAYAEAGPVDQERKRRLEEAPEALQGQVEAHLRTCAALRRMGWQQRKRRATAGQKDAWDDFFGGAGGDFL